MADRSLFQSIIEHDSDKLIVYGSLVVAVFVGPLVLDGPSRLVLFPLGIVVAFLAIAGYYYRQTVSEE
jgi:hypothetical protein